MPPAAPSGLRMPLYPGGRESISLAYRLDGGPRKRFNKTTQSGGKFLVPQPGHAGVIELGQRGKKKAPVYEGAPKCGQLYGAQERAKAVLLRGHRPRPPKRPDRKSGPGYRQKEPQLKAPGMALHRELKTWCQQRTRTGLAALVWGGLWWAPNKRYTQIYPQTRYARCALSRKGVTICPGAIRFWRSSHPCSPMARD